MIGSAIGPLPTDQLYPESHHRSHVLAWLRRMPAGVAPVGSGSPSSLAEIDQKIADDAPEFLRQDANATARTAPPRAFAAVAILLSSVGYPEGRCLGRVTVGV